MKTASRGDARYQDIRGKPGRHTLPGDRGSSVAQKTSAQVEYQVGDRVWTHAWIAYEIDERKLERDLGAAGLRFGRWLSDDRAWFTAIPATG
jgi:hypothetical protein